MFSAVVTSISRSAFPGFFNPVPRKGGDVARSSLPLLIQIILFNAAHITSLTLHLLPVEIGQLYWTELMDCRRCNDPGIMLVVQPQIVVGVFINFVQKLDTDAMYAQGQLLRTPFLSLFFL